MQGITQKMSAIRNCEFRGAAKPGLTPVIKAGAIAAYREAVTYDAGEENGIAHGAGLGGFFQIDALDALEDGEALATKSAHSRTKCQALKFAVGVESLQDFVLGFDFHKFAWLESQGIIVEKLLPGAMRGRVGLSGAKERDEEIQEYLRGP